MTTDKPARDAYPLAWPDNWPRSKNSARSQFKTSTSAALDNVRKSLQHFQTDSGQKVSEILISSNVTLGDQNPRDAGVACYFTWGDLPTCIAVDRYGTVRENLQAIHHVIEAERTKLRHGGLNIVRAAFQGYARLPPPSAVQRRQWFETLELPASATILEAEQSYKRLRSQWHPDKPGGDGARFDEVQKAIEAARQALR
jgi:hypothetical protein